VLLERETELALLDRVVGEAVAGDGRLGLVEGPAGIGKTRLVAAARERAASAGMQTLSARGSEMERAFPFGVVRQLFEPAVARLGAAERAEVFAGAAGLAERLLAEEGESAGSPFALYHGLYWLTANLSVAGPLTLLVDDLHWADPPSLAALEYIGRRLEGLPVLLVLASRTHEPGFDRAVLDELARESSARVFAPRALSEEATAALVRERLPEAADAFCRACHEATGGNPLLVAELASALEDESVSGRLDEAGRVTEIGPEAVARAVRLRTSRLPAGVQSLARAASVLGDGASLDDAAALAGLDRAAAAAAAQALAQADILEGRDTLVFVHPVVRAAVYTGLGAFEQSESHARAARLLGEARRPAEQIAAHVLQCPPAGSADAVETLRSAARRSLADGAAGLAASYLERALEEPPPAGERPDVLFELGGAEQLVNGPKAAEHLREAMELTESPVGKASIALGLGRALYFAGAMTDAAEVFQGVLADPPPDPALTRSIETSLIVLGLFEPPLVGLARERLQGFDPDGPLEDLDAKILLAYGTYDLARSGSGREVAAERALRIAADREVIAGDSQGSWAALAGTLWLSGRFDEAEALADGITRAGEDLGSAFLASSGAVTKANALSRRGRLADALAYWASGIEMASQHGFVTVTNWAGAAHALGLVDQGDGEAALEVLRGLHLDGPLPDTVHLYEARLARGRARIATGLVREGVEDLRDVGRRWELIGARNPDAAPWRAHLAEALLLLGETDEARVLAVEHLDLARAWGAAGPLARALRVHGITHGDEESLRQAVEASRGSGARLELALSLVELGAAERRGNRRTAARELLEEGVAVAHDCGARGLEDRALAELLATGARPRRAPASGRDALTPSELRVAEMAAGGQTNREVAQRLFVTQKTVEAHLARAFRKLGIESRAQLPSALGA
jgi:DNA-binding CsgD family transcriptional regulator